MSGSRLITTETPEELFRNLVRSAVGRARPPGAVDDRLSGDAGRDLSDDTEHYLVTLLVSELRCDLSADEESTLAEAFLSSNHTEPRRRAESFRRVGDRALIIAGYFPESWSRKPVGPEYVKALGSAAYSEVAGASPKRSTARLFRELSARFARYAEILGEVSESVAPRSERSITERLDKWLATKSLSAWKELLSRGVIAFNAPVLVQ